MVILGALSLPVSAVFYEISDDAGVCHLRCTEEEEAYLRDLPEDLVADGWRLIMAARPQARPGPGYMAIYRRPSYPYAVEHLDVSIEQLRSGCIRSMRLDSFRQDFADPKYRTDMDASQFNNLLPEWLQDMGWAFRFVAHYETHPPHATSHYCVGLGRYVDGVLDLLPGYSAFRPEDSATMVRDALVDYYGHRDLY